MREVVIVSAARTPIGKFGGSFGSLSAVQLGAVAAKEAIIRANINQAMIEEVIIGNVLGAGLGQNVARQVSMLSGIPESVPAETLGMVCGSGLRAIALAAQIIKAGDADVILAGGTESMSNAPYLLDKARWGQRMGDGILVDSMIHDGLWDAFNDYHMGITAENIADQHKITRQMQDEFALESQQKAEKAIKSGQFRNEIVDVHVPQRNGKQITVDSDEFPRFGVTLEDLSKLKPSFKEDGTVTAGNCSGVNDGAAMVVLMSREKALSLGIQPLATICSYASVGLNPSIMGYGAYHAAKKALLLGKSSVDELDLLEANEAFASQSIAVVRDLGIDIKKVNVNGGAIALGHPIGASGARILVTLLYALKERQAHCGLATLCIGGGMGTAMLVKRD